MKKTKIDDVKIGDRFGRLTVECKVDRQRLSLLCDCGRAVEVSIYDVTRPRHPTISCGCMKRDALLVHSRKHGMYNTKTYRSWINMKNICYNPGFSGYEKVGGQGIAVCDEWKISFENFLKDMGEKPAPNFNLTRINKTLGYYPENCKWVKVRAEGYSRGGREAGRKEGDEQ